MIIMIVLFTVSDIYTWYVAIISSNDDYKEEQFCHVAFVLFCSKLCFKLCGFYLYGVSFLSVCMLVFLKGGGAGRGGRG